MDSVETAQSALADLVAENTRLRKVERATASLAEAFRLQRDEFRVQRDALADNLNGLVVIVQSLQQKRERMAAGLDPTLYLTDAALRFDLLDRYVAEAVEALRRAGRLQEVKP